MSYTKTILCLANSRKPPSGRCVAGKEVTPSGFGDWIRPVSDRPGHEISAEERRYENGIMLRVLDVVRIPLKRHAPLDHQTENHLISEKHYWALERVATWKDVRTAVDPLEGSIWVNGYSTSHGQNDRVPDHLTGGINSSLLLLEIPRLRVDVAMEGGFAGAPRRRRVRATFEYAAAQYSIFITDPEFEDEYIQKGDGNYRIDDTILCISLGESFHGYSYKLAAAIFTKERCRRTA
jgi:hypothetical protein